MISIKQANSNWQRTVLIVCCLMIILSFTPAKGANRWHTDVKRAMTEAHRINKPLIIHFYADWCGPCKKMDRDVLHSSGLLRQFGTRFVGVKLNSDHNQQLANRLGIRSLPSDVFVHPDGWVMQKSSGSKTLRGYFSQLAPIETKFNRIERMKLAKDNSALRPGPRLIPFEEMKENPFQRPDRNGPAEKQPVVKKTKPADTLRLQPDMQPKSHQANKTVPKTKKRTGRIVGLSAFSPVTLKDKKKWVRGSRQFSETYQGITYYMRSHTEAQRFKNAPERYVPRYLGCDAVILKQYAKGIPGSTRYAAFYSERLYLFAKPTSRIDFKKKPSLYSDVKNTLTIDSISR